MNKALNLYDLPYQGNPFYQAIHYFFFICFNEKKKKMVRLYLNNTNFLRKEKKNFFRFLYINVYLQIKHLFLIIYKYLIYLNNLYM